MAERFPYEEDVVDSGDDEILESQLASSSTDAYRLDPLLNKEARHVLDEDRRRQEIEKCYNNVLERQLEIGRKHTIAWCSCEICPTSVNAHPRTLYCCKETTSVDTACARKVAAKLGDLKCITEHPEFAILAINRTAVAAAARMLADAKYGLRFKDEYEPRELRFAAYRNITLWLYGRLGRKNRRILPACVVSAIRTAFPNPARLAYTDYRAPYERVISEVNESDIESDVASEDEPVIM